jgi:hypothetical protein
MIVTAAVIIPPAVVIAPAVIATAVIATAVIATATATAVIVAPGRGWAACAQGRQHQQ